MSFTKELKIIIAFLIYLLNVNVSFCQTGNVKNKIISINGFLGGRIPLSKIKNVTQLNILPPFKLISTTVYFSNGIGVCTMATPLLLNSNKFTKNFLELWKRLSVNSIITFENIQILKSDGIVAPAVSVSFLIVEDK